MEEQLYQLNLAGGETMFISVPPTETIKQLKKRLKDTMGIVVEFNDDGTPLDEETSAASYFSYTSPLSSGMFLFLYIKKDHRFLRFLSCCLRGTLKN